MDDPNTPIPMPDTDRPAGASQVPTRSAYEGVPLAPPRPVGRSGRRAPAGGRQPAAPLAPPITREQIQRSGTRASVLWEMYEEEGFPYILKETAQDKQTRAYVPYEIRVRRPPLQHVLASGNLPSAAKNRINALLADASATGGADVNVADLMSAATIDDIELAADLGRATLITASIDPLFYLQHPHDRRCHLDGTPADPSREVPIDRVMAVLTA